MNSGDVLGQTGHLWVKDLTEEGQVEGLYLVKEKKTGTTRRGDAYVSVTLADKTGEVEGRIWEKARELGSLFKEGDIIKIQGTVSSYRDQIQITISNLELWQGEVDVQLFIESTPRDIPEMAASLMVIVKRIGEAKLRKLAERFLNDRDFMDKFKKAPAAKHFHHNYLGGLLEHTLSVCELAEQVKAHYPDLDGDLLVAGAFLHDIGKVRELQWDLHIDYTDEGRLLGHVVLGCMMLEEKLAHMKGFPQELALRLKHLILSHHGQFEFGSPKRPKFREAFALHLIDDLDAKMNGLERFMQQDRKEGAWTEYNRLFERYLLKGELEARAEREAEDRGPEGRQERLF